MSPPSFRRPGGQVPCALAARARSEPLAGTASLVRGWVLVEQPGPWGPDAIVDSRLDAAVGRALAERGDRHHVRVVLIRRPGWPDLVDPGERRRCFVAHTSRRGAWLRSLELEPADLLDLDWAAIGSPDVPPFGDPVEDPLFLVCTHGRHDPCCADFGRPLARTLAAAGVGEVWESSHVGGDRFAANVVALPSGAYFGRVSPEEGPSLLRGVLGGTLPLERYRGRSCFAADVQVSEVAARRALDVTALRGVELLAVERPGGGVLRATWAGAGTTAVVTLRRFRAPASALTCTAAADFAPWAYEVVAVDVVDAAAG